MKEQLIQFTTASLAKEKGFDWPTVSHYDKDGNEFQDDLKNSEHDQTEYSTPNQALLQKWLREKKCLIEVYPVDDWNSWVFSVTMEDLMQPFFVPYAGGVDDIKPTYEEALEAGLQKALELI